MNEWKAIDKDTNWNPVGKPVTVICHDGQLSEVYVPVADM